MKPQTGAQQHRDQRSEVRPLPSDTLPATPAIQMSERQRQVLEALKEAGTGLTARQLQARVSCSASVLEDALAGLMELQLVSRLNTLIPSFSYRRAGSPGDAE